MRPVLLLFVLCFCCCFTTKTYADSPLTSVNLWLVHPDDLNVQHAFRTKKMDQQSIEFLLNEENALEIRICVVNAIGWKSGSNQKSSRKLLQSILKKYNIKYINELQGAKYAPIISIYSYSLALDNYFDVNKALELSQEAVEMNSDEPIIKYISLLIRSQENMNSKNNCGVYSVFNNLDQQEYFRYGSGIIILNLTLDYVKSYNRYCN
jgi:hypothetical protein